MKLLALMKKEFIRFFRDPRLIISMILPGILIYIIYSIMGSAFAGEAKTYDFKVYLSGESAVVSVIDAAIGQKEGWTAEFIPLSEEAGVTSPEEAKNAVENGEATAFLAFPESFDETVAAGGSPALEVTFVYNSGDAESAAFVSVANPILNLYGSKFLISSTDFAQSADYAAQMMAGLLPFLIVVFVFSSCMSVTLESVAGEKERGTLATILVTSARRWDVALGKILPLACVSLIGAVSSFLGVALSLPKLMGVSIGVAVSSVGAAGYFMMLLLILSFVPLIVAAIAAVSTLSRSVKEASGYTSVIMILMMILSIVTAFVSDIGGWVAVVPVLNAVCAMQGVLAGEMVVWQCLVSAAVNLVYAALLVFLVAKMLSSEKIMFGK